MMIEKADFEQFPNVTVITICTRNMTADVDSSYNSNIHENRKFYG